MHLADFRIACIRLQQFLLQIELISELEATHARLLATLPKDLQQHYWSRHEQAGALWQGGRLHRSFRAGFWNAPPGPPRGYATLTQMLQHRYLACVGIAGFLSVFTFSTDVRAFLQGTYGGSHSIPALQGMPWGACAVLS